MQNKRRYNKKDLDAANTTELPVERIKREAQRQSHVSVKNTSSRKKKPIGSQSSYNYEDDYVHDDSGFREIYEAPQDIPKQRQKNIRKSEKRFNEDESEYIPYPDKSQRQRDPYEYSGKQRNSRRVEEPAPRKPRRRKKGIFRKILNLIIILFIIYSVLALICIASINKVSSGERSRTSSAISSSHVTNVLLIGTDSRNTASERGRSDSMILVSINSRTRKLWFTSFLRDAYVEIPGHGSGKLNSAYSYGGADLLMDTIERNYNISIDYYVSIGFKGFASLIDSVGGVKVTLSDDEANALNIIMQSEVNEICGDDRDSDLLDGGGTYVLNGKQALSYSRIRYVGNADFERTSRQREVIGQVFTKLKTLNPIYIVKLFTTTLPQMTTNMPSTKLYILSLRVPTLIIFKTERQQIPADGTFSSGNAGGQSVLNVDFSANQDILKRTIFAQ